MLKCLCFSVFSQLPSKETVEVMKCVYKVRRLFATLRDSVKEGMLLKPNNGHYTMKLFTDFRI